MPKCPASRKSALSVKKAQRETAVQRRPAG